MSSLYIGISDANLKTKFRAFGAGCLPTLHRIATFCCNESATSSGYFYLPGFCAAEDQPGLTLQRLSRPCSLANADAMAEGAAA